MPKKEIMPQPQNGLEISGVELLQQVASFYENAWTKLLVLVTFLITFVGVFVGVVMPFLIQRYQRRLFQIEEESLKQEIRKQVEEIRASLSTELCAELVRREEHQQAQLDSRMAKMKDSLDKRDAWLQGSMFHIQARTQLSTGFYGSGLESFLMAAIAFLESGREGNLRVTLEAIIDLGLPKITNEIINNPEFRLEVLFPKLISALERNDDGGRYTRSIGKLKGEWKKANERSPKPSDGNT